MYDRELTVFLTNKKKPKDFHMTPQAATSYHSGATFDRRPWLQGKGDSKELFNKSKMNASAKDWQVLMATEIVAQYLRAHGKIPGLQEAKNFYLGQDSHCCIEGHMPSLIPLSYVEKVIMPPNVWAALPAKTKELFAGHFRKDNFVLMQKPTGARPFDPDVYGAMVHKPTPQMGLIFTLSNNFLHHCFMPAFKKLSTPKFKIRFSAIGANIFIVLSDTDDLKKGTRSHLYHIGLNCDRDCKAWVRKGLSKQDKSLVETAGFNEGRERKMEWLSLSCPASPPHSTQ